MQKNQCQFNYEKKKKENNVQFQRDCNDELSESYHLTLQFCSVLLNYLWANLFTMSHCMLPAMAQS